MKLPEELHIALEKELEGLPLQDILKARAALTERYLNKKRDFITDKAARCAYLAARLPSTFAAISRVLKEAISSQTVSIKSLLDLGAGPGTAMWACRDYFPLEKITLIEKDRELAAMGKRLSSYCELGQKADWKEADLEKIPSLPPHDLVLLSYSLGELSSHVHHDLIKKCWEAAQEWLIIIEPGTPAGFERLRTLRNQLISLGAHMIAPCPHALTCPMAGKDWCHFAERVERSSLHRRIKEGTLSYEDEKFSYLVFSKNAKTHNQERILRYPQIKPGHVVLTLCSTDGVKEKTVSKRTPEDYKKARKADWGSLF